MTNAVPRTSSISTCRYFRFPFLSQLRDLTLLWRPEQAGNIRTDVFTFPSTTDIPAATKSLGSVLLN